MTSVTVGVLGLLTFGTVTSLLAKIIFGVPSLGIDGQLKEFRKPLFETFAMFYGMSFCFVLDMLQRQKLESKSELVEKNAKSRHHSVLVIWFPAAFDLIATVCMCTGLLYTTVSVYQMLRGAMLVFTALFSVLFLKRKLTFHHYVSIFLNILGISLVGLANILSEKDIAMRGNLVMGIILMIFGQCAQAAQVVVEEYFCQDLNMPSIRVVTYEGLFGVAMMLLIVFPLAYWVPGQDSGSLENILDSFIMIEHSWILQGILLMDVCCMLFFNYFSMNVTKLSSSMFRTLLETMRTMIVWIVDILLYYFISQGQFGEPWTQYSFLQVIGFMFLVIGTFQYSQYPTLPVSEEEWFEEEEKVPLVTDVPRNVTMKQVTGKEPVVSHINEKGTSQITIGSKNPPKNVPSFYSSSPSIFMRHGGFSPSVYSSEILELEARQSGSLSSTVE
ncbi:Solute carrier family 35 member F6 [Galdieria sulphuraria]|uniref:EamA domain-containing protein n=1 Tax=Galdieria sulphuraria TaxID=130081 RepID=M2XUU8_GALSU|nr:hypothetical protein Gasu_50050 isoform 1 [Galdieria sulphuraria]EME27408.1 hypothetical protein Gasu_50050 isoform 1 [Galdieria sulphuraria]GJD09245.1 Solute carrier family 35 member F6 [Galdieria sulphuraria]|eukprot:XP_005703928.1 hypothetical protein isoform 1 [Galdieria sulphuraria]